VLTVRKLSGHDSTFDNPAGYLLSVRGTAFLALCAYGFFFGFAGTTGVLFTSVLDFVVWDGGLPLDGIS
jgi:hypothetical protein